MPDYYQKNANVETIYSRSAALKASASWLNAAPEKPSIPTVLHFILTDNKTILSATTDQEILIGRRSRQTDPIVTIDLIKYQGHELGVSRMHLMIAIVNQVLCVQDLNSVNGSTLNDQRMIPLKWYPLHSGDVLILSNLKLRLRFSYG